MSNRYLADEFAPVQQEYTLTDLDGHRNDPRLPRRPLPAQWAQPDRRGRPGLYHWFIGDGMVHGIRIRDGKAEWYRNRWVRGPLAAKALGEPIPSGNVGVSSIGANTNVIGHAGKTLALIEGGVASYQLTDELDTVGICDFDGTITGGYTAHPKRDPKQVSCTRFRTA